VYRASKISQMERPGKFEHHRFVGDKRSQIVYDIDESTSAKLIDRVNELMQSEQYIGFSPDTLAEARNRGYRIAKG